MKYAKHWTALVAIAALVAGCARQPEPAPPVAGHVEDGSKYLLDAEPAGAAGVIAARERAQDQDEIVMVGRIGGSTDPWVEDLAAFSVVDLSLKACSDIEGDACPTPWDYCCDNDRLPTSKALVKFVDAEGNVLKTDARDLLKVEELQTVVVRGKAQRDDAGNLIVLASGVYVRPDAQPAQPQPPAQDQTDEQQD